MIDGGEVTTMKKALWYVFLMILLFLKVLICGYTAGIFLVLVFIWWELVDKL